MAQAAQGNPKATMAAIEIRKNPGNMSSILDKFYTPETPEMSPEEEAMVMGAGGQPGMEVPQQEPDIGSVLAGLAGGGPPPQGGPLG